MKTQVFTLISLLSVAQITFAIGEHGISNNVVKQNPGICFTENKGQVYDQKYNPRPDVLYGAMAGNMAVHIKKNGVSYQLYRVDKYKEVEDPKTKEKSQEIDQQTIYRVDLTWLNANKNFTKSEDEALHGYNNYYLESCPNGVLNVKSYKGITINNLYPGINLHYYEKNGELKHDYIVAPHADYKQIQIKVEGAKVTINKDGSLLLRTPLGIIQEGTPIVFQNSKQIKANWRLVKIDQESSILNFDIKNYDSNLELLIDPVSRIWGTYYSGGIFEKAYSCITDTSGNVFIAGETSSSSGTTIATSGAHQMIIGGGTSDAFLAKFTSAGQRQWGTYYGGFGAEYGNACTTDASGNVFLVGNSSFNSGTVIATLGSHQPVSSGVNDAFLVKFNAAGQRQWGTFYGGTGSENAYSCCTDALGNVYMTGFTTSYLNPTVIATAGSHQSGPSGNTNHAFLVKFSSSGVRLWGTYYGGGTGVDIGRSCATDIYGNVYLAGNTSSFSSGTLIATANSHQTSLGGNGSVDAFLVKFDANGVRKWGTFYGGTLQEAGYSCATDALANVYLAGWTASNAGTIIATSASHQSVTGGGSDAFLVKFDSSGTRLWGTYYGGASSDEGYSCATDAFGNVFLAGQVHVNSTSGIATPGCHQPTVGAAFGTDGFLVKFSGNGVRLCGTYYGGSGDERGNSCSVDLSGNTYMAGFTTSNIGTNVASPGSHQPTIALVNAGYLVKFAVCYPPAQPSSIVGDSVLCSGTGVKNFSVTQVPGALTYTWSLPSGWTGVSNTNTISANTGTSGIIGVVADSGCGISPSRSLQIVVNSSPTVSVNSGSICIGQSYTIGASGANTYTISGGSFVVNPNVTTTYTVSGTSAEGCVALSNAIALVIVHNLPTITVNSGSFCSSQNFVISPTGASTYSINGGNFIVSPSVTTSFSVFGTSSVGCVSASVAICHVTPYITPTVLATSGSICLGESFIISPSGANTYSISGGSFLVSPNITTSYSVTGTSTAGCVSAAAVSTVNVSECVGISVNPDFHSSPIKIYPNPNNGLLNLESDSEAQVLFIDLQGRIVGHQSIVSGKNQISIEHLENGVYFIQVSHLQGKEVFRIIKQ